YADARRKCYVSESPVSIVVIEIAGVVGEVCFENIQPTIAVVVADRDSHPRLLVAVVAVCATGGDSNLAESAVVVVVEEHAGLGVHGDMNVGPAIVVEIVRNGRNRVTRTWLQDA